MMAVWKPSTTSSWTVVLMQYTWGRLVTKVTEAYSVATRGEGGYEELEREEQIEVMMGKGIGSKTAEGNIDHAFKRFLKRAWRKRKAVTKAVEEMTKSLMDVKASA